MEVLFTYDFSTENLEEYVESKGPTLGAINQMEKMMMDQELVSSLRGWGVDVQVVSHRGGDISEAVDEVRDVAEQADLVFHDSGWAGLNAEDEEWQEDYRRAIGELIDENFLHKSHFSSSEVSYTDKRSAIEIAEDNGIPLPETWGVDEFLEGEADLPVVMKAEHGSQGKNVYFFDREGQAETFWKEENYRKFGEKFHNDPDSQPVPDKDDYLFQDFIETPSEFNTHYRLIVTRDGEIVAGVLGAAEDTDERINQGDMGIGKQIYHCEDSPLFLNMKNMASNAAQGGRQIPLNPVHNSRELDSADSEILEAHGLDPQYPDIPDNLAEAAKYTGEVFGEHGVIYSGQDWIQDQDGDFYLLEINPGPGMQIFDTLYNQGKGDEEKGREIGAELIASRLYEHK